MIDAYVDGRPMPSSSSRLTSEASVYRAGGWVVWPTGSIAGSGSCWPTVRSGSTRSRSSRSASGSSEPST